MIYAVNTGSIIHANTR